MKKDDTKSEDLDIGLKVFVHPVLYQILECRAPAVRKMLETEKQIDLLEAEYTLESYERLRKYYASQENWGKEFHWLKNAVLQKKR